MGSSEANDRATRRGPRIFLSLAFAVAIAAGIPSGVPDVLRPWAQYLRFIVFGDLGDKVVAGRDGWLFYRPAVDYANEPWSIDRNDAGGNIIAAIVSFRDQLAERGIPLLVMPAPNKASIYPDGLARRAGGRGASISAQTREVLARLRAAGVEVLDLFEVFADPDAALYLAQDSHWSPAGVRVAARAAASRMIELGWVARESASYSLRPVAVERRGDLLRMIQAPPIERAFPPEAIECEQVIDDATGEPCRDDPQSPVLVIGDSFLRIYSEEEPGAAGFVAHLARELGFAVASLVNDGGGSTLVRQQLARKPALITGKKVLVWEFVERDIRFGIEGWQDVPLR